MRILITAGPTREPLDPVRYLSNRSSGKMGWALAQAAADSGHAVALVSGPVAMPPPPEVEYYRIETAQQMFEKVQAICAADTGPDIAILAAAVADYRPKQTQSQKIKKHDASLSLELERTPDVLGSMRSVFGFRGVLVGFAAETEDLVPNALEKLRLKQCDMMIANDVGRTDSGFDSDENEVIVCLASGAAEILPKQPKCALAREIIRRAAALAADQTK